MKSLIRKIILFACVGMLFPGLTFAQLFYGDNVNVKINPGAQISVKGDLELANTGSITNEGTIDLSGDIINNSGGNFFTGNNGSVFMNGAVQNITGSDIIRFNNLTLQGTGNKILHIRTISGGGGSGTLDLDDRILELNGHSVYINNNLPSGIIRSSGGILCEQINNNSFVEWNIANNLTAHEFPFINSAGDYIPLTYHAQSGTSGNVTAATYATAPNNTPYPAVPILVDHVRDVNGIDNAANTVDRFWYMNNAGATADITFSYSALEQAASGNLNMRAQKWQTLSNGWELPTPGQSNPGAGSVLVPGVVNLNGIWAIASEISPLPVELLSFDAIPESDNSVNCLWTTASEINSDHFVVQRSKNAIDFEYVGKVPAAGFSNSMIEYSTIDTKPYMGVSYYRLMQVDRDGTFEYSKTVAVNLRKNLDWQIYPTLTEDLINIKFQDEIPAEIFVYSATGQLIFGKDIISNDITLSCSSFEPGIYFITFFIDQVRHSERILVAR